MRLIRHAPVTAESLVICVAIFVSCSLEAYSSGQRFSDIQREWGAIRSLHMYEIHDGVRRPKEPELFGPFDVWNGEFWRIPVTVFHHADVLHLVMNLAAAWYLGRFLERRWGSFRMLLFMVPASCIPIMAELCLGNAVIGFSGVICAMLGALAVLREYDGDLAEALPIEVIEFGFGSIAIAWLLTLADIVNCANVAHVVGLLYGAGVAAIVGGPFRNVSIVRMSMVFAHAWLVPAMVSVSHPDWIGRYDWYQSTITGNDRRAEAYLEKASNCDPSLAGVWLKWSQIAEEQGDRLVAWIRLVKGIEANPASANLVDGLRRLWRHLDSDQRRDAGLVLDQLMGERGAVWLAQIRNLNRSLEFAEQEPSGISSPELDVSGFSLDRRIEFPPLNGELIPPDQRKATILKDENQAVEGKSL